MERLPPNKTLKDKVDGSTEAFVASNKGHKTSSRQRGIKASRIKLEKALHAAGLKTQAALANIIADKENLDSPPKDLVNKAFRERPVELQTIERIADALGVEAYTLYLSSDDIGWERTTEATTASKDNEQSQSRVTPASIQAIHPQQSVLKKSWYSLFVLAVLLVIF